MPFKPAVERRSRRLPPGGGQGDEQSAGVGWPAM